MEIKVAIHGDMKFVRSELYNYDFNYKTGWFARWGKTKEDDPQVAPFPEICDLEVTTKCSGPGGKLCKFCYKSNTPNGQNMSFETFKIIIDKMKMSETCVGITQCAIGADATCESNPDLFKMMEYARECYIVPNITVADISDDVADKLASLCGAVAVSRYDDKDICYDSVKKLTDRGMTQVNIHIMVSEETYSDVVQTMQDYSTDPRLAKLNAIVLLSLKQKGRGVGFTPLSQERFTKLVDIAMANKVPHGFDSCSAPSFLIAIKDRENYKELAMLCEPCEATLFSSYINTDGEFFSCSFCECQDEWVDGIDVVNCDNFVKDVWMHPRVEEFRDKLIGCSRNCPMFNIRTI